MAAVITSLYRAYCYARLLEMRRNRRRLVRTRLASTSQPRARNNECRSSANIAFRLMQAAGNGAAVTPAAEERA
jgi:hypothetical protein